MNVNKLDQAEAFKDLYEHVRGRILETAFAECGLPLQEEGEVELVGSCENGRVRFKAVVPFLDDKAPYLAVLSLEDDEEMHAVDYYHCREEALAFIRQAVRVWPDILQDVAT